MTNMIRRVILTVLGFVIIVGSYEYMGKTYSDDPHLITMPDGTMAISWTPDEFATTAGYVQWTPAMDAASTAQSAAPTTTVQPTKKVKGSYIQLANGSVVKPGGTIPMSQLATAVFVNGTGQNVMYTAVASQGAYRVKADPEPNWAYEASVAAGGAVPLAHYATYMLDPYYTHLTVELRGTKDYEYSFAVNKAQ